MTADERLIMQTTIILHGFRLYCSPRQPDRRVLVGRPLGRDVAGGQMLYEAIAKWKTGEIAPTRTKTGWSIRWKELSLDCLSSEDLTGFYNTVLSTC